MCRALDTAHLAKVWARSEFEKKPFPEMLKGSDWERIRKKYLKKVRKIRTETKLWMLLNPHS